MCQFSVTGIAHRVDAGIQYSSGGLPLFFNPLNASWYFSSHVCFALGILWSMILEQLYLDLIV